MKPAVTKHGPAASQSCLKTLAAPFRNGHACHAMTMGSAASPERRCERPLCERPLADTEHEPHRAGVVGRRWAQVAGERPPHMRHESIVAGGCAAGATGGRIAPGRSPVAGIRNDHREPGAPERLGRRSDLEIGVGRNGIGDHHTRRGGRARERWEWRAAIPLVAAILAWGGLYLRDNRIRQLLPFRRAA